MKQLLIVVAVVVVLAGVVFVLMRSPSGGQGGGTTPANTESAGDARSGADPSSIAAGVTVPGPDAEALARLREEIAQAEPVEVRSDEEILAAARAWVDANRDPDNPYNGLEAKMLALMDMVFDGTERSAEWVLNMQEIEVEMIRALDSDGDGLVSDDEVVAYANQGISMFNPMEHPYLKEKFDTNGDGELTADELEQLGMSNITEGALAGAMERARLEAWDTDMDGSLSAAERQAGEADMRSNIKLFPDGRMEFVMDASEVDPVEQAAVLAEIEETLGVEVAEQLKAQQEAFAAQSVAQPLLTDMRLETMDPQELQAMMMENMPTPPAQTDFDADGDGEIGTEETAAYMEAIQEFRQTVQDYATVQMAEMMRLQFEHATSESDTDGDGRMMSEEWEARLADLHAARDDRLWLRSYDTDGSGRVDGAELDRYIGWYREGSLRADTNFDGAVNALDLQEMAMKFQQQLR